MSELELLLYSRGGGSNQPLKPANFPRVPIEDAMRASSIAFRTCGDSLFDRRPRRELGEPSGGLGGFQRVPLRINQKKVIRL